MAADAHPLRFVVVHHGEPPAVSPDPWAASDGGRITQLARAIATSDGWIGRPPAVLVVRPTGEPVIAAIGRFTEADEHWLAAAGQQMASVASRVVCLDQRATEATVIDLAEALSNRFGHREVRRFRFAAVPRGGLIVLGLLAYALGVPRDRLTPEADAATPPCPDVPLVLVDDIALSGLRLSHMVARRPDARLVVATLHAHPDMRAAFITAHPRVEAFVAARDLHDHAPTALASEYGAWRDRWHARAAPGSVWIGQPDHVVYPWNEPDLGVWNPITEREEPGWSLMPPERCLKRRTTPALELQRMAPAVGCFRPDPQMLAGEIEGQVVIGHLGTGASFALEGVAADMWRALAATGDPEAVVRQLVLSYDVDAASLTKDVTAFVADLRANGLLVDEAA